MKPLSERLKFGTQLHEFVLNAVKERREMARAKLSKRHAQWRKNEDLFLAYIPPGCCGEQAPAWMGEWETRLPSGAYSLQPRCCSERPYLLG